MAAARIWLAAVLALAATASALYPSARGARERYCRKVHGLKVYVSGVACAPVRCYIALARCPRGWRRCVVYPEFGRRLQSNLA